MKDLDFNAELHEYRLGGVLYPSVTQILREERMLRDLSFLPPFYRERGSATHAAIAIHWRGQEVDWNFAGAEHVRPRFEKFLRLKDKHRIEPIIFEHPLASRAFGYAGTPDLLCRWDGAITIPDWKGDDLEPGHRVQVSGGYRGLLVEMAQRKELDIDPAEILKAPALLVPLGTEREPEVVAEPSPLFYVNLFRAAAACRNWREAYVPQGGRDDR